MGLLVLIWSIIYAQEPECTFTAMLWNGMKGRGGFENSAFPRPLPQELWAPTVAMDPYPWQFLHHSYLECAPGMVSPRAWALDAGGMQG